MSCDRVVSYWVGGGGLKWTISPDTLSFPVSIDVKVVLYHLGSKWTISHYF